jgi:alpha-1,3-rhamnosyltransferase
MSGLDSAFLTIILSSYNYELYVDEAMAALTPQLNSEVHLLIIDDGSTDDSVIRLKKYIDNSRHITLIVNQRNSGVIAVINQGLELTQSPWVLYSAMDDKVYPDLIDQMLPLMVRYPQAGVCTAPADHLDFEGRYLRPWLGPKLPDGRYLGPAEVTKLMRRYGFWFAGMTSVLAVKPLKEIGGFDPSLGHLADSFVTQQLALQYGMATLSEPMAGVRNVPGSFSRHDAGQLDTANDLRQYALKRMGEIPELFPEDFRRDWEKFSQIWDCLRAWKYGPEKVFRNWLAMSIQFSSGGRIGRILLKLNEINFKLQKASLIVFAVYRGYSSKLFKNWLKTYFLY